MRSNRMFPLLLIAFLAGIYCCRVSAAADFQISETRKSVVFIRTMTPGMPTVEGSGFLVSADGVIYTNRHVVRVGESDAGAVIVVGVPSAKDPEQLDYFPASLVFATKLDDALDFAILKIAAKPEYPAFKPLALNFHRVELGSNVAVMGFPYVDSDQPSLSFNKGTVSTASRKFDGYEYCQTDAAVNRGNSGGPLLTPAGEAVAIVTAKKMDAENIGFAVYLSEIQKIAAQAATPSLIAAVHPDPGPLDPTKLPKPDGIKPLAANWDVGAGTVKEVKKILEVDNNGPPYWLVSKKELPTNFQITIPFEIAFLQGRYHIQPSQESLLRTFCFRFGSPDTTTEVLERKGYLVEFSHSAIWLWRESDKGAECVAMQSRGNSDEPMILTVTCNKGDITVTANEVKLLEYHDDKPLPVKNKFCIGGFLSELVIGEVQIVDLDAKPGSPTTQALAVKHDGAAAPK